MKEKYVETNHPLNFIFLIYVPRSGSTLLSKLLNKYATNLLVLPEFRLLELLIAEGEIKVQGMNPEQLIKIIQADHQFHNLGLTKENIQEILQKSAGKGIRKIIEEVAKTYASKIGVNPEFIVIKRGDIISLFSSLIKIFPETRFIHVYRDVRGVINSTVNSDNPYQENMKMGRDGDYVFLAKRWVKFLTYISQVKHDGENTILIDEIKYEELCRNESMTISNLLTSMKVKRESSNVLQEKSNKLHISEQELKIHKLVNQKTQDQRINAWMNELDKKKGYVTELISKKVLIERGYESYYLARTDKFDRHFFQITSWVEHWLNIIQYNFYRILNNSKNIKLFVLRLKLRVRKMFS